jgi:hypothetical protein
MESAGAWSDFPAEALPSALRTQSMRTAMANALAISHVEAPIHFSETLACRAQRIAESPVLCGITTLIGTLVICLVVRPPFLLHFKYDARRPWKGQMRMSWMAVVVCCLIAVLLSTGLPLCTGLMRPEEALP